MNTRLFSVLFAASLALVACKSESTSSDTSTTGGTGTTTTTDTGAGGGGTGGAAQGGAGQGGAAQGGAGQGGAAQGGAGQGGAAACSKCAEIVGDPTLMGGACDASKALIEALMACACDKCAEACADSCGDNPQAPSAACGECVKTGADPQCGTEFDACANDA